jgi:hypothetical protein
MSEEVVDDMAVKVRTQLNNTKYACSSWELLTGGSANFIYRGVLDTPLPDGTEAVAIKHGEGYVASNPGFPIPTTRCVSSRQGYGTRAIPLSHARHRCRGPAI